MKNISFVFPGQGSQYVGMGKELFNSYPIVQETFLQANRQLEYNLIELCFLGSEEKLRSTQYAQVALFVFGVSVWRLINEKIKDITRNSNLFRVIAVGGHSLGEYNALLAAEVLDFFSALELVKNRSFLMQEAITKKAGTMAALLGANKEEAIEICKKASENNDYVVTVANINSPGQIVISGEELGVKKAVQIAKEIFNKKAIFLNVSGAFHSPLMKEAAEKFSKIIEKQQFKDAKVPVVMNVNAAPLRDATEIKSALINQMSSPVLWEDSVKTMIKMGTNCFIELGAGNVLSKLIQRIDNSVVTLNVEDNTSLQKTLDFLQSQN